jgi:hypothetical protein
MDFAVHNYIIKNELEKETLTSEYNNSVDSMECGAISF